MILIVRSKIKLYNIHIMTFDKGNRSKSRNFEGGGVQTCFVVIFLLRASLVNYQSHHLILFANPKPKWRRGGSVAWGLIPSPGLPLTMHLRPQSGNNNKQKQQCCELAIGFRADLHYTLHDVPLTQTYGQLYLAYAAIRNSVDLSSCRMIKNSWFNK